MISPTWIVRVGMIEQPTSMMPLAGGAGVAVGRGGIGVGVGCVRTAAVGRGSGVARGAAVEAGAGVEVGAAVGIAGISVAVGAGSAIGVGVTVGGGRRGVGEASGVAGSDVAVAGGSVASGVADWVCGAAGVEVGGGGTNVGGGGIVATSSGAFCPPHALNEMTIHTATPNARSAGRILGGTYYPTHERPLLFRRTQNFTQPSEATVTMPLSSSKLMRSRRKSAVPGNCSSSRLVMRTSSTRDPASARPSASESPT